MRQDQIEALEFMLDDYGVEGVLEALADALGRKVSWLRCAPLATEHGSAVKRYMLQAEALRAQASALAAGRALTYATQAPLETLEDHTMKIKQTKRWLKRHGFKQIEDNEGGNNA